MFVAHATLRSLVLCRSPPDHCSLRPAAPAAMEHSMELTKEAECYKLGAAARTAAGVIIKQTHAAPKNPGAKPEEVGCSSGALQLNSLSSACSSAAVVFFLLSR